MELNRFFKIKIINPNDNTDFYDNYTIGNTNSMIGISAGTMSLSEILCDNGFELGAYNSNSFEVQVFNLNDDVAGYKINVTYEDRSDNQHIVEYPIFVGTIDSSKTDNMNGYRDIVAYDALYAIRNKDMADIWNDYWETSGSSTVTHTLKEIRNYMCQQAGLTVDERFTLSASSANAISCPNDSVAFTTASSSSQSTIGPITKFSSLKFHILLKMLCELQAVIPNITRDGKIEFIVPMKNYTSLDRNAVDLGAQYDRNATVFNDAKITPMTGYAVYGTSSDKVSQLVPAANNTNPYPISGNAFLLNMKANQITYVLSQISSVVNSTVSLLDDLTPSTVSMIYSNLNIKLGDLIKTKSATYHLIFSQNLSGSQLVNQEIINPVFGDFLKSPISNVNDDYIQGLKFSEMSKDIDSVRATVGVVNGKVTTVETTVNGFTVTDAQGNRTLIDGSKIKAGTIETDSIASGSITSDKLSVGSINADLLSIGTAAKIQNLIVNGEFVDGINKWTDSSSSAFRIFRKTTISSDVLQSYPALWIETLSSVSSGSLYVDYADKIPIMPNTQYSFGLGLLFYKGRTQRICSINMFITQYDSSGNQISGGQVGFPYGYRTLDETQAYGEIFYKLNNYFVSASNAAYVTVRFAIFHYSGYVESLFISDIMLLESEETWVTYTSSSNIQFDQSFPFDDVLNPVSGNVSVTENGIDVYNGAISIYDKRGEKSFYADDSGQLYAKNLRIEGTIEGDSSFVNGNTTLLYGVGELGKTRLYLSDPSGDIYFAVGQRNQSGQDFPTTRIYPNRMFIANSSSNYFDLYHNQLSIVSSGITVLSFNTSPAIDGNYCLSVKGKVKSQGTELQSSVETKTNITPTTPMLAKILSADIYNYDYIAEVEEEEESGEVGLNSEEEEHIPQHYGLVIGEGYSTPEEVINKSGDAVDLYSMISIAWKAIQELNDEIESLESRIQILENNS